MIRLKSFTTILPTKYKYFPSINVNNIYVCYFIKYKGIPTKSDIKFAFI